MDDPFIAHDYDALKRREYYLKTRELKGRQPNSIAKTSSTRSKAPVKVPPKTRQQRQAERRHQLEAQVSALKARLETLRTALAELVKAAKARSGVKEERKLPDKKPASKVGSQKQTASQKAEDAKKSKEYYEKHKDELLADEVKSLNEKIKAIQERIAKMRKTSSVGAKNTQSK